MLFSSISLSLLLFLCSADAARLPGFLNARDRNYVLPPTQTVSRVAINASTVISLFTPSPSAMVTTITSQGQLVVSYIPQFTLCPMVAARHGPVPQKRQVAVEKSTLYANESTSATACTTIYSATVTPICHATLTPLGGLPITIRQCQEHVTFSTDHGYTVNDYGDVDVFVTKYHAPWADVVTGVSQDTITAEVCNEDGECSTNLQSWGITSVEDIWTSTSTVSLSTTLTGVCIAVIRI